MKHNYKLTDFNIMKNIDTNIYERIVSIDLSKIKELPSAIVGRLEILINEMITAYEQKHDVIIPTDNAEVEIYMEVDTKEHTLSLNAYVGYSPDEQCVSGKEVVTAADSDYTVFKDYFFNELNKYINEQMEFIKGCVE